MPLECYVERKFSPKSLEVIDAANAIIDEYQAAGFTLTLRQLYYQFVSRDLIANRMAEYKRLGSIISDGRLAGLIDWSAIEDRTRNVEKPSLWESPEQIIEAVADQYREDPWKSQTTRVEVWIEKDALIGVIEPVCREFDVPYFACRGNVSQSEQWAAGKRFERWGEDTGQSIVILHLGDHDPSGIDMTRDNRERLNLFSSQVIEVRRLALNMDQVRLYRPPPNPAKVTDSRFAAYEAQFGDKSWELDALDPKVIDQLIRREIESIIDQRPFDDARATMEKKREVLRAIADNFEDVRDFLLGSDL